MGLQSVPLLVLEVDDGRSASLTQLTERERAVALERFQLLQPALEERVSLAALARERRIPLRTAQRWHRRYRQQGLAGLARTPHRDRGQRRLPEELRSLIEGLALRRPRGPDIF